MTDASSKLWQVVQLLDVSLISVDSRTELEPAAVAERSLQFEIDFSAVGHERAERSQVEAIATLVVQSSPEPLVRLETRWRLTYSHPPGFLVTGEDLDGFAANNGILNVWPYWREFVNSIFSRMALHLPPLPVFRVGEGALAGPVDES